MTRITVAVCTWNRARLLDRTLARLRELCIPDGIDWELLVVNNNSTDETEKVLDRHAGHLPLRRLVESKPGKANAANRAAAEARGELILWTDDDVLVDRGWLAAYAGAAARWRDAAVFGGPVEPLFEAPPPVWVQRSLPLLTDVFALSKADMPAQEQLLPPPLLPYGANMALRAAVQRMFPYNPALGPQPGSQIRNEDAEMMERLRRQGHQVVWIPGARVQHVVPAARMTVAYVRDWKRGEGRSQVLWRGVPEGKRWAGVPRWLWRRFLSERLRAARLRCGGHTPEWTRAYMQAQFTCGMIGQCRLLNGGGPDHSENRP